MPGTTLHTFLQRIRRRLLLVGGMASLCWALTLAAVVLLVSIWLDLLWDLTPVWRLAATACALLAGLLMFATMLARTISAAGHSRAARRLDRAAGGGGTIVSGWELAGQPALVSASASAALTAGLAQMAVDHATQIAETVPTAQAVSSRPMHKAAGTVAALFASCSLAAVCLPSLTGTEMNRFLNPFSDVPLYSAMRFSVEPGDVSVLYGAGLDVHVTVTSGSVEQVELLLDDGDAQPEVVPMFPEPGQQWRTTLTRLTQSATYFVRARGARSKRYRIDVITVPRIDAVRFRITSPAYINEAPYECELPKSGLAGLPGTRVLVLAKSNRPLRGGVITLQQGSDVKRLSMQPVMEGSDEVTGEFVIERAGKFQVAVIDIAGQSSQEPFGGGITLLEDQRPFVRMLNPQKMSLATPSANLPVVVAAEDDYGISRIVLFRSLNNSRPLPLDCRVEGPAPRRWQYDSELSLATYGLSPGDEIKLFARVEDNDPAGGKGAESPVATVRIISQSEFERMLQQRKGLETLLAKYQAAQRRVEHLQQMIATLEAELAAATPDAPVTDALRAELKRLIDALQQNAQQINESAEHRLPYDLDENLAGQLHELADHMAGAADAAEKLTTADGMTHQQLSGQLKQLAERLAQGRQQFQQQAMQPLEHLARIFPLLQDQSRFVELAQRQRDLSERMATLKGHDGEDDPALNARMRELEAEQRVLRVELKQLLDDIEDHANQLPEDPQLDELRETAHAFVAALRTSGAEEAMSAAETALAESSGTRGYEQATRAAEILERYIKQCNGMGQTCQGCLAFNPSLGSCLGNTVQQLLAGAGYGSGSGMGVGAGGGYSARRGMGDNVGLYGGLPGQAGSEGVGFGARRNRSPGVGSWGSSRDADPQLMFPSDADSRASGWSEGSIPASYRQRVGQYFLRIAEEAGDEP
ncbi:MAG: hypothetical protein ACYC4U_00975 [Pirellulaceae bacterium]